jgi:hypothetical protein
MILALAVGLWLGGCGSRSVDVSQAEQKVAEAEKQLEAAKAEAQAAQRVAELEKQLEEAKQSLAAAKGGPAKQLTNQPAAQTTAKAPPPEPPKPKQLVLPAGTPIPVRTTIALSTKTAATGSTFEASLMEPLVVDGVVVAPKGADVTGLVALSDPGGRVKGRALLRVTLRSINTVQGPVTVQTSSRETMASSTVKRDVVRGGIMAGAGAAIGAIAGGGKGAAIGAGAGGAAGAGTAMATRGDPAVFPAESALTFTLRNPVTVTVQP